MPMSSLIESLMGALDQRTIGQMAQQLGSSPQQTAGAVQAALPMLLGMLSRNAQSPQGAQALSGALQRDHQGGVLDDVLGFLGQGSQSTSVGSAILGHVLGGNRPRAEHALSQQAGLAPGQSGQLLAMLAPIVMGALGRQAGQQGGFQTSNVQQLLGGAMQALGGGQAGSASPFSRMLDTDGDGDVDMNDIAKHGMSLLSGFLRR
jgi:hypothetical protein